MKKMTLIWMAVFVAGLFTSRAQTADEILANYFENTGGLDNWKAMKGLKMTAKVNQGGTEIPLEIVQLKGGQQYTKITFQGQTFYQGVFDGETLWNTSFMTMQPEKADAENTANFKLEINDFPDPFIDYKAKNYTVELLPSETIEGTEVFKIKLVREPKTVGGVQRDDISFYYFDKENFVPIARDSEITEGPMSGKVARSTFSDYQEVNGLYFPFSIAQGIKDEGSSPLVISAIELNPTVDAAVFKYTGN